MKKNLHSHTQFCDGRASMEEMLRAARKEGFSTWGFSPHSPVPIESPCNMLRENVTPYKREIERLRSLFPDIAILAGMEVDFLDDTFGPASSEIKEYGPDYVIGSVHFIPNQKGDFHDIDGSPERFEKNLRENFEGDLEYVVSTYWSQVQRMIRAGGLDIIGHIDKISLNASSVNSGIENTVFYRHLADATIDMAIKSGKAIEINTKHYKKYGRFFPAPRYWKRIKDAGIAMPVNSDAHYPEKVSDGMREAYELLKKFA